MSQYTPITIKELISEIECGRKVLPSMQRNFVWAENKTCKLFESLMHDYPIGTFLFWKIDNTTFHEYIFNTFIKDYDEQKGKMQRGERATAEFSDYMAVLDGQQRITSLYMGLKGKYRTHIKGRSWDNPASFIDRFLCINILHEPTDEDGYQFQFKIKEDIEAIKSNDEGGFDYWVKVSDVYDGFRAADGSVIDEVEYTDLLSNEHGDIFTNDKRIAARKMLRRLKDALTEKLNINYYSANGMKLSEVVEIFVRVNSGGERLNSADLMLSVASGALEDKDAHVLLQEAIDYINDSPEKVDEGFKVDKELILTAGLMLTDADSFSLKKPENWTTSKMNDIFKDHWDAIIEALRNTVMYIEHLGFIGKRLTSKNLILPIAYYFYINNLQASHMSSSSNRACCDRVFIRQWMLRAMMNNVFSDATGNTLISIRNVIKAFKGLNHFPLEELMKKEYKKRSLKMGESEIEDVLELKWGDSRIKPIFCELTAAHPKGLEEDHIWPKSVLTSKKKTEKAYPTIGVHELEEYKARCHKLPNLQLLTSTENGDKGDTLFDKWVYAYYPDSDKMNNYLITHLIPKGISYDFKEFINFYDKRRELLKVEIGKAFPDDFTELVGRYNLGNKL